MWSIGHIGCPVGLWVGCYGPEWNISIPACVRPVPLSVQDFPTSNKYLNTYFMEKHTSYTLIVSEDLYVDVL